MAERLLQRRTREVENEKDGIGAFIPPEGRRLRFDDLADDFLREMNLKGRKSSRTARSQLKNPRREFGREYARNISAARLRSYQEGRLAEGAAPATIDREVELTISALRLAHRNRRIGQVPEVSHLLRKHGNARKGFVHPSEFQGILDRVGDPDFRDWLSWFFWTGMRNGEISSLSWDGLEDGNPQHLTLFPENAKIGEARKVPLVGPLVEIIDRRIQARWPSCPLVFNSGGRSFARKSGGLPDWAYRLWREACDAAGVPSLRPYDLRRSAARNLIRAGIPEAVAMKIMGHKSRETFRRYAIFDSEDEAAALKALGDFIGPQLKQPGPVLPFRRHGQKHGQPA